MLEFVKANPWTFAIGGIILLGALVGVIVGVVKKGFWKDRGWLKTESGKEYHWKDAATRKLRMYIEDTVPKALLSDIMRWARLVETEYAKRELFSIYHLGPGETPSHQIDVLIVMDAKAENPYTRHQINQQTGEVLSAFVGFTFNIPPDQRSYIVRHEGGHILCLDHDESTSNVMHPKAQRRKATYSDADCARLRAAYGAPNVD